MDCNAFLLSTVMNTKEIFVYKSEKLFSFEIQQMKIVLSDNMGGQAYKQI